jgi:hypothetical protein
MIEQLIRKYINSNIQRLSENSADITVDTESGWKYLIPSSKSIRGQRANNNAKKNGAMTGLIVIARKRKKTVTNDSKLIDDIKKLFDEVIIPGKYDPIKTLFVYMQVLNKSNKKVWNIWVIDKKRSGINAAVQELLKQQEKIFQRTDISGKIVNASKIDEIDKITFMSYDMANNWFNLLKKSDLSTTLNLPNLIDIKQAQDTTDTDIKESQIVYLWRSSDVEGGSGNRYNVYRTNNGILAGFEDELILYKDIKILLPGSFQGKALMQIAPDGIDYSFTPLEGTVKSGAYKIGNNEGEITFDGKFINGIPASGTAEIKGVGVDNNGTFNGQFKSIVNVDNLLQSLGLDNGTMEYSNGLTFKGKFEKNHPYEGTLYNKQKQILGQYVNGYLKSNKDLKFPYTWNSKDYGVITVYKQGDNVYVRIPSLDAWGETTKDNFQEKSFDGSVKDIFTLTQDPARVAQLNKDILNIEPELPPTPTPTPNNKNKKKKYVVVTGNTINVYTFSNGEFVINKRNSTTNAKDRTTGWPLTSTKSAKIKNGDGRTYKMYKIIVQVGRESRTFYLPASGIKIVER